MEKEKIPIIYALKLIQRRWYSIQGIKEKLQNKKFSEEEIDKAIKFLKDKQMLDDIRFAKFFIKDRLNFRPKAKYLINQELYLKGISKEDMVLAWQQYEEEFQPDELAIITDLARRKLKSYRSLPQEVQSQRLLNFLARRGYSYDLIKKALAQLENEG